MASKRKAKNAAPVLGVATGPISRCDLGAPLRGFEFTGTLDERFTSDSPNAELPAPEFVSTVKRVYKVAPVTRYAVTLEETSNSPASSSWVSPQTVCVCETEAEARRLAQMLGCYAHG